VSVLILILALGLLMTVAYKGFSVIVGAPLCSLLAVLLTLGPQAMFPIFSELFLGKMVEFVGQYLPVFLLGALFGKLMELTGAAASISAWIVGLLGEKHTMGAVVLACAVLTYGGVSLFVVAFAVYPFAKALFRRSNIQERLIPGTIALGSFTFTMDALPGTPQIQNVIPTTFFGTDLYAAPILGCCGALFVLVCGMLYLEKRKRDLGPQVWPTETAEEAPQVEESLPSPVLAFLPLLTVATVNFFFTRSLKAEGKKDIAITDLGIEAGAVPKGDFVDGIVHLDKMAGIYSIEVALLCGLVVATAIGYRRIQGQIRQGIDKAVGGAMLAALNTGSEYGFGAVIAAMPGFAVVKTGLSSAFSSPLLNEAVSVNVLAGITGSASGGMSIALAAMAENFKAAAVEANIPFEVLHRVASMASGGMDTLPHNGAVITLLMITGMTHKQSYRDIFAITCIKTAAVFVIIAIYSLTGLV
jgi:H+/gluconate symporter-like permease